MLLFKKPTNVTNVKFDKVIKFRNDIVYFTEIKEVNPIPSQSIIYKTCTGLGATHSEIIAERDSIIVLPHVSIVISKHEHYRDSHKTFAVHGDIKTIDIYNYIINTDFRHAKFLTTPQGLEKIIFVINTLEGADYRKLFFLLVDECQKVIQDSKYRQDMIELMDRFFEFENKAMISATALPPSDPRFTEQGFQNIKITPDFECKINQGLYIPKVELVQTDSLISGLQTYFEKNKASHYCIFFNSVEGIKSLLMQLEIKDNYQIFCSKESTDLLKLDKEPNAQSQIGELKKYNFFTKSFFSGLDIILDYKPNVIILTDCKFRTHTMLDPYTDILQIVGRFRKHKDRSNGYNKITHINCRGLKNTIAEETAILNVKQSERFYMQLEDLKHATGNNDLHEYFEKVLTTVKPYANLLKDKVFSHYLYDNYLDDERVKNYYKNESTLRTAYYHTHLYNVIKVPGYEECQQILFKTQVIRYSIEMNQFMAKALLNLEDYKMLDIYHEQRYRIAKLSFLMYDAFNRVGYSAMQQLNFNKKKIEKELLKLDIAEGKNRLPVINLAHSTFQLNRAYTRKDVKTKLQQVYDEFKIDYVAKATDVEHYFEFKSFKKGDERVYVFTTQKQFPVKRVKHI